MPFRSSPLTPPDHSDHPALPSSAVLAQATSTGLSPGALAGVIAGVVVVVLLLVLLVGLLLRRRRRISLAQQEEAGPPAPRTGGTYSAGGGFSFTSGAGSGGAAGSGTGTLEPPRSAPPAPETATPPPASSAPPVSSAPPASPASPAPPAGTAPAAPAGPVPTEQDEAATAPPDTRPTTPAPPIPGPAAEPAPAESAPEPEPEPEPETRVAPPAAAPAAPTTTTPTAPAVPGTPAAPAGPTEPIAPAEGRLERLRGRLGRSRSSLGQGLLGLLGAGDLDEDSWEEVEDTLLLADLGSGATQEIVATLRERIAARGVRTPEQARELLREVLTEALDPGMDRSVRALAHDGRPAVLLVAGVNGTGKTTTTGKLARVLVAGGHVVLLGAADTFRAAAAEQLQTWGERSGAEVVRGPEGADPASVAFDAVARGTEAGVDAVLLDTAGRLHTKTGLMDELGKVKRVVERKAPVDEVLLVLDATTGQNGLTQARVFREVVDVSGVVLTKLDGTAKGGIVFQVQRELGVPVKLVGLGEGPDDLAPFEPAAFVDALLR